MDCDVALRLEKTKSLNKDTQFFLYGTSLQATSPRLATAQQLSVLNLLSLIKTTGKEKWSFPMAINVKQLVNRQYTKIQLSQKHYWRNLKLVIINIDFEFCKSLHSSYAQVTSSNHQQPLSNFEPQKLWRYKQLSGLRSDPSCL